MTIESLGIKKLEALVYYVHDIERSREFYVNKLDFKEIEAVKPSLDLVQMSELSNAFGKTLVLNADILPGPGSRKCHSVPPDIFLETCFAFIHSYKVCFDPIL